MKQSVKQPDIHKPDTQSDKLKESFNQIRKSDDFHGLSSRLFNVWRKREQSLQANRKQEIANIKSILSRRVFVEGMQFFSEGANSSEKEIKKIAQSITSQIVEDVKSIREFDSSEAIIQDIMKFSERGLCLVREIVNDNPPGELYFAKSGEAFDPNLHELDNACDSDGQTISLTVYPGYRVLNTVLEKALVFTSSNSKQLEPAMTDVVSNNAINSTDGNDTASSPQSLLNGKEGEKVETEAKTLQQLMLYFNNNLLLIANNLNRR